MSERVEAPRPGLRRTCVVCGHVFVPDGELYCDGCGVRARHKERHARLMEEARDVAHARLGGEA